MVTHDSALWPPERSSDRRAVATLRGAVVAIVVALVVVCSSATVARAAPGTPFTLAASRSVTVLVENDARIAVSATTEGSWAVGGALTVDAPYRIVAGTHQPSADRPVVKGTAVRLVVDGTLVMTGSFFDRMVELDAEAFPNALLGPTLPRLQVSSDGRIHNGGGVLTAGDPGTAAGEPFASTRGAFSQFRCACTFAAYRSFVSDIRSAPSTAVNLLSEVVGTTGAPVDPTAFVLDLTPGATNVWNVTPTEAQELQGGRTVIRFAAAHPNVTTPLVINLPAVVSRFDNPTIDAGSDAASFVLWTTTATRLELTGARTFSGSLLAPDTSVAFGKTGLFDGQAVVSGAEVTGQGAIRHVSFASAITLPAYSAISPTPGQGAATASSTSSSSSGGEQLSPASGTSDIGSAVDQLPATGLSPSHGAWAGFSLVGLGLIALTGGRRRASQILSRQRPRSAAHCSACCACCSVSCVEPPQFVHCTENRLP